MTRTASKSQAELNAWLSERIARVAGLEPESIDPRLSFHRLGVSSADATIIAKDLSAWVGKELMATALWEYPTLDALTRYLCASEVGPAETRISAPGAEDDPIAIVGMACRVPGARDLDAFWELLRGGVDAVTEVPSSRWDGLAFHSSDIAAPGKMNTRWGGFIDDVELFDAEFFGIAPSEALAMDPQQRLMLELAWEAIEDAGINAERLRSTNTGVFTGVIWGDYQVYRARAGLTAIGPHTITGYHYSLVANRISYVFGFEGPSLAIDTACSSSLVAVDLACRSLRRGESAVALAGGVSLNLVVESTLGVAKLGALSPDGKCFAFDDRANGYVRGEGAGLVVLKPLSSALADGDRIYCVVRGSAVNNNGCGNGLTAPRPAAQKELLHRAYAAAGILPAEGVVPILIRRPSESIPLERAA